MGCRVRFFDGTFDEDREFVATDARRRASFSQCSGESSGDPDEQLVACRVSQRIVDRLEVVKIETQHRNRCVVPAPAIHGLFQSMAEVSSIRQTGQAVTKSLLCHFGQQALVFEKDDELSDEHRDHQDSQREQNRPVLHMMHRTA